MTIYMKNTNTNEVIKIEADSYESLSKNFRSEVVANRTNARSYQDQIESCTTIEELNNISTDF